MDFRHKRQYSLNSKALALIVAGILILVNVLSIRYFVRFDWTKNGQYSISNATVSILDQLDDLVTVTAYVTDDLPPQLAPAEQYLQDVLSEYQAYGSGNFFYEFLDPAGNAELEAEARRIGIQQVSMQVRENDSYKVQQGYFGMSIDYQGEKEVIPVVQQADLSNLEYDLSSLIIKLTQPRTLVVGFLQGHGEHGINQQFGAAPTAENNEYSTAVQLLRQTYDVRTIDFAKQNTLEGVDVLVVGGPKRDLTARAIFEIDQYLLKGGKAVFMIDGIRQINSVNLEVLETNAKTLLAPVGVVVESNLLLDTISELTNFQEAPGRFFFLQYPPFIRLVADNFSDNPIIAKVPSMVVRFISSLTITEQRSLEYDQIASTSPTGWYQDFPFQTSPTNLPEAEPSKGGAQAFAVEVKGEFPRLSEGDLVPQLEEWVETPEGDFELRAVSDDPNRTGREVLAGPQGPSQIIVFSDSDFPTNTYIQSDQTGLVVFQNAVDYLALGAELTQIRSKSLGDASLKPLEDAERALLKFLGIALMPLLLCAYGTFRIWMRRKEEKLLQL